MVSVAAERNAHHLKLTHPKLFTDLCYIHAGRLLGITNRQRVVDLLGDIQGSVDDSFDSRTSVAATKKLYKAGLKASDHHIFGCPLDVGIVERFVPVIKFLHSSECLNTEGLFRKSGNCSRLKMIRESLNRGEDVARLLAVGPFNAHDCASLLKAFLSALPEPLLSEKHFSVHSLAVELPTEQHLELLQILVHLLPPANVYLLKHLLGLLKRVCDQKETRMTAMSLGRLFAPHLLIPRAMPATEMASVLPLAEKVVAVMISRSVALFRLPDNVLRDVEHQLAVVQQAAGTSRPSRWVERRCAMKRSRVKSFPESSIVKYPLASISLASDFDSSQSSAKHRLMDSDNKKMVTENSRVIIVDVLANSSTSLNSESVYSGEPASVSAGCCPRTGHFSKSLQRHQNGLRTAKPARKYASIPLHQQHVTYFRYIELKGSVKEPNITIYFRFPPTTES